MSLHSEVIEVIAVTFRLRSSRQAADVSSIAQMFAEFEQAATDEIVTQTPHGPHRAGCRSLVATAPSETSAGNL